METPTGRLFALPTMFSWERAARGAGLRRFTWGDFDFEALACTNKAHTVGPRPSPVNSFPWDESPWGIRGMVGNVTDYCLSDAGVYYRGWRAHRGGGWNKAVAAGRLGYHHGGVIHTPGRNVGFRTTMVVRLRAKLGSEETKRKPG